MHASYCYGPENTNSFSNIFGITHKVHAIKMFRVVFGGLFDAIIIMVVLLLFSKNSN